MIDDINRELGRNMAENRVKRGLTQKQIADRMTDLCGKQISAYMVASWERGMTVIPAATIHFICQAIGCTSYDLFPHSTRFADDDVLLLQRLDQMPERQKDIFRYMANAWHGDTSALWEFGLLYAVLPEHRRQFIAHAGVQEYKDAVRNGMTEIDNAQGLRVDLAKIIRAMNALDKEE